MDLMQLYFGSDGRVLKPKIMKETLEIEGNTKVIEKIEDGSICISAVNESLNKARHLVKKHCKSDSSIVDEFIQTRRNEE